MPHQLSDPPHLRDTNIRPSDLCRTESMFVTPHPLEDDDTYHHASGTQRVLISRIVYPTGLAVLGVVNLNERTPPRPRYPQSHPSYVPQELADWCALHQHPIAGTNGILCPEPPDRLPLHRLTVLCHNDRGQPVFDGRPLADIHLPHDSTHFTYEDLSSCHLTP